MKLKRKVTTKEKVERLKRNEKKWTKTLMDAGWTAIPSVILERQKALGLSPLDVNILLQLARHWWYRDKLPFPSKKTLADCIDVHPSTIQRSIAAMEKAGLIERQFRFDEKLGQKSNAYSFEGLIKEATPFAEEALESRESVKKANADRLKRKKPKLKVVEGKKE